MIEPERVPPPPRSPWLKKRYIALYLVLAAATGVGAFSLNVMYAPPGITVDYRPMVLELTRRHQGMPEGAENGWLLLKNLVERDQALRRRLCDATDWGGPEPGVWPTIVYDPTATPPEGRGTPEQARSLALLYLDGAEREGIFAEIDRVDAPQFAARTPLEERLLAAEVPEVAASRSLARACAARMYLASQRGDDEERLAAFRQALTLARITSRQATVIEFLEGGVIRTMACTELRHEMGERPLTATDARLLLQALDRSKPEPLALALEGERLTTLDGLQTVFSDTGNGNGRLLVTEYVKLVGFPGSRVSALQNLRGLFLPGRRENTRKLNEFFDHAVRLSRLGRCERLSDSFDHATFEKDLREKYFLYLGVVLPAVQKVIDASDRFQVDFLGTRIMIAIEGFRSEHGAYPQSLAELVPTFLSQSLLDPSTGMPFGYRRIEPSSDPHGRPYLLYSYGPDLTDDHGKPDPARMGALRVGNGFDFVFNEPR